MSQLFVLNRISHQKLWQNLVGNWSCTLWKLRLVPLVGYSMDLYKEFLSCLTEELLQRCRRNREFLFYCLWDIAWWYEVMLIIHCIILQFVYSIMFRVQSSFWDLTFSQHCWQSRQSSSHLRVSFIFWWICIAHTCTAFVKLVWASSKQTEWPRLQCHREVRTIYYVGWSNFWFLFCVALCNCFVVAF